MAGDVARFIPYIILALLGLALLLFIVAVQLLRRGRTAPFWRLRRTAGQRGGQLFLLSIALFGLAVALAVFSGFAALAVGRIDVFFNPQRGPDDLYGIAPTALTAAAVAASHTSAPPTPTAAPTTPTTARLATNTPPPTATYTPSASPTIAATATPAATATATYTASPTFETALKLGIPYGARPPAEDATLRIVAADNTLSDNQTPVEPREIFESGLRRIYLFTSFRGMENGVAWSRILYRDGVAVQGSTLLWAMGEEGSTYFYFGSPTDYPPGTYRVELWLGSRLASSFDFVILRP
jgi:hypothetical protein